MVTNKEIQKKVDKKFIDSATKLVEKLDVKKTMIDMALEDWQKKSTESEFLPTRVDKREQKFANEILGVATDGVAVDDANDMVDAVAYNNISKMLGLIPNEVKGIVKEASRQFQLNQRGLNEPIPPGREATPGEGLFQKMSQEEYNREVKAMYPKVPKQSQALSEIWSGQRGITVTAKTIAKPMAELDMAGYTSPGANIQNVKSIKELNVTTSLFIDSIVTMMGNYCVPRLFAMSGATCGCPHGQSPLRCTVISNGLCNKNNKNAIRELVYMMYEKKLGGKQTNKMRAVFLLKELDELKEDIDDTRKRNKTESSEGDRED